MNNTNDVKPNFKKPFRTPFKKDQYLLNYLYTLKCIERFDRMHINQTGFLICPLCKFKHTEKTLFCKFCNYP